MLRMQQMVRSYGHRESSLSSRSRCDLRHASCGTADAASRHPRVLRHRKHRATRGSGSLGRGANATAYPGPIGRGLRTLPTCEPGGPAYMGVVINFYSPRIIGWSTKLMRASSFSMQCYGGKALPLQAHTHGTRYGNDDWLRFYQSHRLEPSMSRHNTSGITPSRNRSPGT